MLSTRGGQTEAHWPLQSSVRPSKAYIKFEKKKKKKVDMFVLEMRPPTFLHAAQDVL